jgi:hypothetical protein
VLPVFRFIDRLTTIFCMQWRKAKVAAQHRHMGFGPNNCRVEAVRLSERFVARLSAIDQSPRWVVFVGGKTLPPVGRDSLRLLQVKVHRKGGRRAG